ncbi:MAG: thiazole synthase, partial [Phycisphaerales bacterium]|nr:thiazole synthase [Phycisphaerales bacterium]
PDPMGTLEALKVLKAEDFTVLCYTNDDPIMAQRLKDAGADSVMPAGSPIGSGQGVLNPWNIRIILEQLKADDPDFPIIVDAGVGTASDVTVAMELGADGVLLNTGISGANDPIAMAQAMQHAMAAGILARQAGRIPRKLYATASSPIEGVIGAE